MFYYSLTLSLVAIQRDEGKDCTLIVGPILTLTHWALLLPDFGGAYRRSVGKMNFLEGFISNVLP